MTKIPIVTKEMWDRIGENARNPELQRKDYPTVTDITMTTSEKDMENRKKVAEALGHSGANFAWSYLLSDIEQLIACENELIELRKMKKDALRWKMVQRYIGADRACCSNVYTLRGIIPPENVMRGSVAEHFTKSIDKLIEEEENGF